MQGSLIRSIVHMQGLIRSIVHMQGSLIRSIVHMQDSLIRSIDFVSFYNFTIRFWTLSMPGWHFLFFI